MSLGETRDYAKEAEKVRSTDMLFFRCGIGLKGKMARAIILLLFLL